MATWTWIVIVVVALVVGGVVGFFIGRWFFQRQMKNNPPISEKQIRAIYASMGRTPSEAKVREIMNQMKNTK